MHLLYCYFVYVECFFRTLNICRSLGFRKSLKRCVHLVNHISFVVLLTFAGFAIAAQAESGATAAGSRLVTVSEQTDIRAASSLPKLVHLTCMASYWRPGVIAKEPAA